MPAQSAYKREFNAKLAAVCDALDAIEEEDEGDDINEADVNAVEESQEEEEPCVVTADPGPVSNLRRYANGVGRWTYRVATDARGSMFEERHVAAAWDLDMNGKCSLSTSACKPTSTNLQARMVLSKGIVSLKSFRR